MSLMGPRDPAGAGSLRAALACTPPGDPVRPRHRDTAEGVDTPPAARLPGAPPAGLRATLERAGQPPQPVVLPPGVHHIGRDAICELQLDLDGVAPLHARLAHVDLGWTLTDLDGRERTRVNGAAVLTARLADGDVVELGPVTLRLAGAARRRPGLRIELVLALLAGLVALPFLPASPPSAPRAVRPTPAPAAADPLARPVSAVLTALDAGRLADARRRLDGLRTSAAAGLLPLAELDRVAARLACLATSPDGQTLAALIGDLRSLADASAARWRALGVVAWADAGWAAWSAERSTVDTLARADRHARRGAWAAAHRELALVPRDSRLGALARARVARYRRSAPVWTAALRQGRAARAAAHRALRARARIVAQAERVHRSIVGSALAAAPPLGAERALLARMIRALQQFREDDDLAAIETLGPDPRTAELRAWIVRIARLDMEASDLQEAGETAAARMLWHLLLDAVDDPLNAYYRRADRALGPRDPHAEARGLCAQADRHAAQGHPLAAAKAIARARALDPSSEEVRWRGELLEQLTRRAYDRRRGGWSAGRLDARAFAEAAGPLVAILTALADGVTPPELVSDLFWARASAPLSPPVWWLLTGPARR